MLDNTVDYSVQLSSFLFGLIYKTSCVKAAAPTDSKLKDKKPISR